MQLEGKALDQRQLAAAAQQFQGDAHGQWRAAVQQPGGFLGPVLELRAYFLLQCGADGRQVWEREALVDRRAQGLELCTGHPAGAQGGQQGA
ncbi:hypothetical protein D3C80_1884100 [compost metagenome]